MSGKPPTVRDVARAAGVSIAVVSYAFNRPDRVAVATRERVLVVAAALGYPGPHAAGRALRLGRHGAVAMVAPGPIEALLADPAARLRGPRPGPGLRSRRTRPASWPATPTARPMAWSSSATRAPGAEAVPAVVVGGPAPEGVPCVRASLGEGAAAVARHLARPGPRPARRHRPTRYGRAAGGRPRGMGDGGAFVSYEAAGPARANGEVAARVALGDPPTPHRPAGAHRPARLGRSRRRPSAPHRGSGGTLGRRDRRPDRLAGAAAHQRVRPLPSDGRAGRRDPVRADGR